MRYLRKQVLNRRAPWDQRLSVDINNAVVMSTTNNLTLPTGTTAQRPVIPTNGMIRYNTTNDEIEVYQATAWRSLRFKESTQITQQNLGAGDSSNVYFGPLNPAPPTLVQSGTTWGAQNILVIIESVIQISNTNYTIVQNPTIPSEVYNGTLSSPASSGTTIISFNSHVIGNSVSGNGTTATIVFDTLSDVPFAVGSLIIVSGFRPTGYNGTYTVTASTSGSVSYANVTTSTMTDAGDVVSTTAIYPSVNIENAVVTGSGIAANTRVQSYVTEPTTNALLKIIIDTPTTSIIARNLAIVITDASEVNTGYYLKFGSPVPYGKTVTVLHGFDK
jgi:hypothetical protein